MNLKWFKSSVNEEIDECMVNHITIAVYDRSDIEECEQLEIDTRIQLVIDTRKKKTT